jgi:hypothetical protein
MAYGGAIDKIWGILSARRSTTFDSYGKNSFLIDSDLNCVQARTVAQGSYNPSEQSTGAYIHFPDIPRLVLVVCGMVAFDVL